MIPPMVIGDAAAALLVGAGLVRLQERLERWAYDRHAEG